MKAATNLKNQIKAVLARSGQILALLAFIAACTLVMATKAQAAGDIETYKMNIQASFVVAVLALAFIARDARATEKGEQ